MDLIAALGGLEPAVLVLVVAVLPYVMLALGRLVPRSAALDWKEAYFKSEEARQIDRDTTARLLTYAESADALLRAALGPGLPHPPHPTIPPPRGPDEVDT